MKENQSEIDEHPLHIIENLRRFKESIGKHYEITEYQRSCMKIRRKSAKINASQTTYFENSQKSMAHRRKSTDNLRKSWESIEFSTFC